MTITTDECIHGLTPMTCSICLEPSHRKDEPVGSLSELVREALAAYPGEDQELVLRIVYAEAVALPNGFDLFHPHLRSILSNFDGASRRNIQREIDLPPRPIVATYTSVVTAPAAFFQDEPIDATPTSDGAARPGPFVPEATPATTTRQDAPPALPPAPGATAPTSTIPDAPLVPFPGRDQSLHGTHSPDVPPGTTLAQYSRERRDEIERSADVWMVSFARKYADAPMRLRNSWKGRLGEMSLAQVLDKRAEVLSLASGLAQTLTMLDASARVLAAYPEFHSIDEFNAAQKLPALGPTHVTPTICRTAPEQEEL